jgi:hypothetical protein
LISRRIKEYGLDTSHFVKGGQNRGQASPLRVPAGKILVRRLSGNRQKAHRLRRALIESGVAYCCVCCGNPGEWVGKPISLQVNHINRDWLDDRKKNLEFLCPNCHSQTEGWCNNQGMSAVTSDAEQHRRRRARAQK